MNIQKYESVGKWYEDMKLVGYRIPPAMGYGITLAMQELNMKFPEVFNLLEKNKRIILVGKIYIYDLRGHKGLRKEPNI